ncbi:MAG: hypothetical protein IJ570_04535 [Prevotella sp.]|nr:hypothetical protein [Prevotella sp.]
MRKSYKMLLALVALLLGGVGANAQNLIELEAEMFKSWSSPDADAVPTDETAVASDGELSCTYALFENLGAGGLVYGHTNVYYLWYADLTGTNTISFEGTAGLQLRVLMNRPAPEEGGDSHGGATVERNVTLDAEGKASLDVSDLPYVHLNAIKLGWGSPAGTMQKIMLEGTVKPVSGWVNLINNSDMEGDDVSSFFSKNNAGAPEPSVIKDGVGVNGSRGIVVEATALPETGGNAWDSQFWFRFNEPLEAGQKYRVSFDYRADTPASVSTQAHAEPSDYIHYELFGSLNFTSAWQTYENELEVTASQSTDAKKFLSAAFNLNELRDANNYYFDNIVVEIYKEKSPMAQIKAGFEMDCVAIDFGANSNIKTLVGDKKRLIFPDNCVEVKVNGQATTLTSVEAKPDGKLYIFIEEGYSESEEDKVTVSFTNPADAAYHLSFVDGRWAGEDVPSFTDLIAEYESGLGNNFSYLADAPELVKADPEDGSFNLPLDLKEFHLTFDNPANAAELSAKFDKETLTVSPADGFATEFTLTRTGSGNITAGMHTLYVNNVRPQEDYLDLSNNYELSLSFGPVDLNSDDKPMDIVPISYFNDAAAGGIPEGFKVLVDGEEGEVRTSEGSYGSGPRVFEFPAGGDFTKALYLRNTYVEFGSLEGYELPLEAGKNYEISFNTARWKASGEWFKLSVLDANGEELMSEMVQNNPDVNGNTGAAVTKSTAVSKKFSPAVSGNYILRWSVVNADGTLITSGYTEPLLANVLVKYVPNAAGVEQLLKVNAALENAKEVLAANEDSRYEGAAYNTLAAAIAKYDGMTFTAPSVCETAVNELNAAAAAMSDHHNLCNSYDSLVDQVQEKVDVYVDSKFANTDVYATLKAAAAKYVGVVLKDNDQLTAAVAEMTSAIDLANGLFTEGESKCTTTGYAALGERIRLGIEDLKALGVSEEDALIVAASNVLGDDDNFAEALKNRVKLEFYGKIKNGEDPFALHEDPTTGEMVSDSYDMTVFVKNPNIYRTNGSSLDFNEDNVPGWVTPEGFSKPGLSTGWSDPSNGNAGIPSDCMFQTWGSSYRVEQTVTDLPAGVYTLKMGFGERMNDDEGNMVGSFTYAKTSATPVAGEGEEEQFAATCDVPGIGQSYPVLNAIIEGVVVTDGVLTIGANGGSSSHTFFNDVRLLVSGTAAGFDYAAAYDQLLAGIDETVAKDAKVRAVAIYDLNGRQMPKAQKGVNIVKELLSDGTVRTVKVVIK